MIKAKTPSTMKTAADTVRTLAGEALGAAAAAATAVVVKTVANAIEQGGRNLGAAEPGLEKSAARAVSQPILPKPKASLKVPARKGAAAPKAKNKVVVKKKVAAKKKIASRKKHR